VAKFKTIFRGRFRDKRSDKFHFMLLELPGQKKGETPQGFADRCRSLTQKTIVKVEDPGLQIFFTSMLLKRFTDGMIGTPGRQGRYARASR